MSQPQHQGPGEAAPETTLLGDLISYYQEDAGAGRLRVCRQAALTHRAQRFLDTEGPRKLYLPELVAPNLGAIHSWGAPSPTQPVCHELVQALEFLELISVNLLLCPWRKEIRSLKTYTGNFAYWVQPALSEQTVHTILGRLGYMATSEAEFSLVQAISKEDIKQVVFEIFLARVTCEAILRTSSRPVLGLGREKPARPYRRRSSKRKLVKAHNCPERPRSGPPEGQGSERALPEGLDCQSTVPMALSLPEVSTSPRTLRAGLWLPLDSQHHASTRSDSEEFLTCYSDLVLHQTPLFPRDFLLRSLNGDQAQPGLPAHLQVRQSPPWVAAVSGPWSPVQLLRAEWSPFPGSPARHQTPNYQGNPWTQSQKHSQSWPPLMADTVPPNTSSELDELCESLSHLLGSPSLADHSGGFPGPWG